MHMKKKKVITALLMTATMMIGTIVGNVPTNFEILQTDNKIYAAAVSSEGVSVSNGAVEVTDEAVEATNDAVKIASLHNPVLNETTGKVTFSYVYFGCYPQSEVTGAALTEEIINAEYVSGEAVINGVKYERLTTGDVNFSFEQHKESVLNGIEVAEE